MLIPTIDSWLLKQFSNNEYVCAQAVQSSHISHFGVHRSYGAKSTTIKPKIFKDLNLHGLHGF